MILSKSVFSSAALHRSLVSFLQRPGTMQVEVHHHLQFRVVRVSIRYHDANAATESARLTILAILFPVGLRTPAVATSKHSPSNK